jgi:hypothetical protein
VAENHLQRALTAMFPYALSSLFLQKAPKNAETQNGMLVAHSTGDCFCTNENFGRG